MPDQPEEMPTNPFSALAEAAMSMHELFGAYVDAGFSEGQALYLVACVSCGRPKEQQ